MTQLLSRHDGLATAVVDVVTVGTIIGSSPPEGNVEFQGNIIADSEVRFVETGSDQIEYVALKAVDTVPANLTLCLPAVDGVAGAAMVTSGAGVLSFSATAAGDVSATPAFVDDNRIVRTDTISGSRNIQQSTVSLNDTGTLQNLDGILGTGASQMSIQTTFNSAQAVSLNATVGGISLLSGAKCEIQSNDTTFDSVLINTPFGGTSIDVAAGQDVTIQGGQILMLNKDAVTKAIEIKTDKGVGETLEIINTQGTTASAIKIQAIAGNVDIDAKSIDILANKTTAGADFTMSTVGNVNDTLNLTSISGTLPISIKLASIAGGIQIATPAGKDVDINGVLIDNSSNIECFNITVDNILALEDPGAGTNVTKFTAGTLASTYTIIYPDDVGLSGQVLVSSVSGSIATLVWDSPPYPTSFINGFEQQWSSVTTIKMGLLGVLSGCRDDSDSFNFFQNGSQNISISTAGINGLSTTYVESADQSYDIYIIGDSTGVEPQAFLIIEENDIISLTAEFMFGGYDRSRRLGWFRNNDTSDILKFFTQGYGADRTYFYDDTKTQLALIIAGNAIVFTPVDASAFLAPTSNTIILRAVLGDSDGTVAANAEITLRPDGSTVTQAEALYTVSPGVALASGEFFDQQIEMPTSISARFFEYQITSATDEAFLYVAGFKYSIR